MSYRDEAMKLRSAINLINRDDAIEIAARADARISELERECSQWRDELRIYRETENARIAELEQSVAVRDTENKNLSNAVAQLRWAASFEKE